MLNEWNLFYIFIPIGILIVFLSILFTGCVVETYQYDRWEYQPIDYNTRHPFIRPELVYIPKYRPRPLYLYENIWYSEPYTIVIYEDGSGYKSRQKVPNSHLKMQLNKTRPYLKREKDVESIMKRVDEERRKKMHNNNRKRRKNTKVLERNVDTYNRRRTRERTKGRI